MRSQVIRKIYNYASTFYEIDDVLPESYYRQRPHEHNGGMTGPLTTKTMIDSMAGSETQNSVGSLERYFSLIKHTS